MMPADAVKIISTTEDARYHLDQTVTKYYVVKFLVGHLGPFTERFVADGFTAAARDARLAERAREVWSDPIVHAH